MNLITTTPSPSDKNHSSLPSPTRRNIYPLATYWKTNTLTTVKSIFHHNLNILLLSMTNPFKEFHERASWNSRYQIFGGCLGEGGYCLRKERTAAKLRVRDVSICRGVKKGIKMILITQTWQITGDDDKTWRCVCSEVMRIKMMRRKWSKKYRKKRSTQVSFSGILPAISTSVYYFLYDWCDSICSKKKG